MSDLPRATPPNSTSAPPSEAGDLSAYRIAEPTRQVDPFRNSVFQHAIAHESGLRAARERGGARAWLAGWLRVAPRPALAGAALSLALLVTGLPLGSLQPTAEPIMRSDPAAAMSGVPEGESADALPAQESVVTDLAGVDAGTPWLVVAGAIGFALSLVAAESVRRRRQA